jgi:hypothetical protein
MFNRAVPVAEPPAPVTDLPSNGSPIPLSHLSLDLPVPDLGWPAYLTGRGIEVVTDDLGRLSIARSDARMLISEQRENEARQAEMRAAFEQRAIEADRLRRAQLGQGVSAAALNGMSYAEAVQESELNSRPYSPRASVVEDLLGGGGGMVFHPIRHDADEAP